MTHVLTRELRRPTAKPRHPWLETERQGSGRAYWFRTAVEAELFARGCERKGHRVTRHDEYVWSSFSTKHHSRSTMLKVAGIDDPEGYDGPSITCNKEMK